MIKEENNYNYCQVVGRTDIGCKRQANEDNMGSRQTKNGLVAVVCDGMGGHVGGATASRIAVETILDFLDKKFYEDPRIAIGEAIDAANQAILRQADIQPELKGMGSTCVLLVVRDGKVYLGHVGDSRIYFVRNHRIKQLTKDHSYVQMLVDMHQLSSEQAEAHPRKNEITNALGIMNMKPATVMLDALLPEAGDCFLLCSDGLSNMVSDREIEKVISRQTEMRAQERADCLIQRAKDNGGLDNITVQLVEFSVTPCTANSRHKSKSLFLIVFLILLLLLSGVAIYVYWRPQPAPANREEKVIRLNAIEFESGKDFLELKYKADRTTILLNQKEVWVETSVFCKDSLKYDDNISVEYNNSLFVFKDKFPADTLCFSLSNAKVIYRFEFPVIKKILKTPVEDFSSKQPKKGKVGNKMPEGIDNNKKTDKKGSLTSSFYIGGINDSLCYRSSFTFKAGEKLLSFVAGEKPGYTIGCQEYSITREYAPFVVKDIQFDTLYIEKREEGGDYHFYFKNQEPEKNLKMTFVVRKETRGEAAGKLFKIIIDLQKK